jgi:hypothetical protein
MNLVHPFVFRTALPLGYLAFALFLLCAAGFGLVQVRRGLRAQLLNRTRALTGIGLLFIVGLLTVANWAPNDSIEFNPIVTVADLEGAWNDGRAVLDLNSNGTYSCSGSGSCTQLGATGRWIRDGDFLIRFTRASDGRVLIQRVVRTEKDLRLTDEAADPDMWDGILTFRHRAPAS